MSHNQIGPYRIIRKLGQGGMGAVFEGINDAIERRVAIKVLHPEIAQNPEFTRRFFNEARVVNRVSHPGLVQVSDYGQMPDGTAYIVMEFLEGESLGSRLKRSSAPVGLEETLSLSRQIADALAATHAKGIIHRDLKPDNVMLVADPESPGGKRAKILDFGIAKLTVDKTNRPKTRTGAVMGTPAYMSPEQCQDAKGIDGKTDVYALGIMLYQMTAGGLPFKAATFSAMILQHIQVEPLPLISKNPALPREVCELVHAMLAKNPQVRPTMAQCASMLENLGLAFAPRPSADRKAANPGAAATQSSDWLLQSTLPQAHGQMAGSSSLKLSERRTLPWLVSICVSGACAAGMFVVTAARSHDRAGAASPLRPDSARPGEDARKLQPAVKPQDLAAKRLAEVPLPELTINRAMLKQPPSASEPLEPPRMVRILPGTFMMGSPPTEEGREEDEIQHEVRITRPFLLSATEITQNQYEQILGVNPSRHGGDPELPAENMSWTDAAFFCNRLSRATGLEECYRISGQKVTWPKGLRCHGYRLPTEAEWEYAARAGQTGSYPGAQTLNELGWHKDNAAGASHRVGVKMPNPWGLYDMSGNVWEWVWDWLGEYPAGPESDPLGPETGTQKLDRGGSWDTVRANLRSANRGWSKPSSHISSRGFRVARSE